LAAPLTPLHGTLVCRGTPVGNHWVKALLEVDGYYNQLVSVYGIQGLSICESVRELHKECVIEIECVSEWRRTEREGAKEWDSV